MALAYLLMLVFLVFVLQNHSVEVTFIIFQLQAKKLCLEGGCFGCILLSETALLLFPLELKALFLEYLGFNIAPVQFRLCLMLFSFPFGFQLHLIPLSLVLRHLLFLLEIEDALVKVGHFSRILTQHPFCLMLLLFHFYISRSRPSWWSTGRAVHHGR